MSRGARILLGIVTLGLGLMLLRMGPDASYPLGHYLFAGFCFSLGTTCFASGRIQAFFGSIVASCLVIAGLSYLGSSILKEPIIGDSRATPSVLNALMFCILFGIPASMYLIHARFGFAKVIDADAELERDDQSKTVEDPTGLWFRSDLFQIEQGEDEEINPGRYGRQLAQWLQHQLEARGYEVEHICEDWGHCLMCARDPFLLWVGCGNVDMVDSGAEAVVPPSEAIVWHCFVCAEIPWLKRLFANPPTADAVAKLARDLHAAVDSEPRIQRVAEP
ncbi:MAG: hypothetical protein KDI71_10765 [Xanthomonadales bacterium]|nr:hypothetical protein [Xanthomonadales bacterium]